MKKFMIDNITQEQSSNYMEVGDIDASNVTASTEIKLPCELELITTMFNEFVKINNILPGNNWDQERVSIPSIDLYGFPLTNIIQRDYLTPIIESCTKLKLIPSYVRLRKYFKGSVLKPHIDRDACHINLTYCIDGPPWAMNVGPELSPVELKPGKGIIYDGTKLLHGRLEESPGEVLQMFCHWTAVDGKFEKYAYDSGKNKEFFENEKIYGTEQLTYLNGLYPVKILKL